MTEQKTRSLALLLCLSVAPSLLQAQFDFGAGLSPDGYYQTKESTTPSRPAIDPFAAALTKELLANKTSDYWATLDVSTSNPAQDLSLYVRRGFGRAEFITLLFIAEGGKQKLKEIAKKRVKGARLRELASQYNLAYNDLRARATALKETLLEKMRINLDNPSDGSGTPQPSTGTIPATGTVPSP